MKKIVVVGSYITDIAVFTDTFPKDGETVIGQRVKFGPGGKGSNQATAARRAGAEVVMVTKTGKDSLREVAISHYSNEGMTTKYIYEDSNKETGSAIIEINTRTAENRIIVTLGATDFITKDEVEKARIELEICDGVLLQLESSLDALKEAMHLARKYKKPIILNPAPVREIDESIFEYVDYITPNETEAAHFTKVTVSDIESARKAATILMDKGANNVIITLGKKGAFVKTKTEDFMVPAFCVKAIDTTGAGDAFNGGFTVAIAEGKSIRDAVLFANAVAALSVTREGTSPAMPYRHEVEEFIKEETLYDNEGYNG